MLAYCEVPCGEGEDVLLEGRGARQCLARTEEHRAPRRQEESVDRSRSTEFTHRVYVTAQERITHTRACLSWGSN